MSEIWIKLMLGLHHTSLSRPQETALVSWCGLRGVSPKQPLVLELSLCIPTCYFIYIFILLPHQSAAESAWTEVKMKQDESGRGRKCGGVVELQVRISVGSSSSLPAQTVGTSSETKSALNNKFLSLWNEDGNSHWASLIDSIQSGDEELKLIRPVCSCCQE